MANDIDINCRDVLTEKSSFFETRCPLCFSRDREPVQQFRPLESASSPAPWKVAACRDCGMMYVHPRPGREELNRLYTADYQPFAPCREKSGFNRWRDRIASDAAKWAADSGLGSPGFASSTVLRFFRDPRFFPAYGQRRLLDFGCGNGSYLLRMKRAGWTGEGIDFSESAAQAAANLGVTVHVGTLPYPGFAGRKFDLITAWESLEHVERPRAVLGAIRDLLEPGGALALSVPNQDGWAARRFGAEWFGLDLPRHLNHFSEKSLSRMLIDSGFNVVALTTIGHPSWIRKSARCRRGDPSGTNWVLRTRLGSGLVSRLACRFGMGESLLAIGRPA